MAIDRKSVGRAFPPVTAVIERERLRAFARATGQRDRVYVDLDAARAAGHPDLPVPPTFLFFLAQEDPEAIEHIEALGIDLRTVLHGEQRFVYHRMVHAGDEVTLRTTVTEIWGSSDGRYDFARRVGVVTTASGEPVAEMHDVMVVRLTPAPPTEDVDTVRGSEERNPQ